MRTPTTGCQKYGQPDFSLEWSGDDFLESSLDWLLRWVQEEVAGGRRFLPEQTVQIGWSFLEVRQRTDGSLAMFEPDFESMPIVFVESVSKTLFHLLIQKSVAESVGLVGEIEVPSLRQSCIVCTEFGQTPGCVFERAKSSNERDSGWFFGCTSKGHDHNDAGSLRLASLYEAGVVLDSRVTPFVGLPIGVRVIFEGSRLSLSREGSDLPIIPGSYLEKKYAAK